MSKSPTLTARSCELVTLDSCHREGPGQGTQLRVELLPFPHCLNKYLVGSGMQGQASGSRASLPLHFVASQMPYFWDPGSVCFTMLVPGSWYLLLVFLGAVHLPLSLWSLMTAALPLSLRFSSRLCSVSLSNKAVPSLSSCSCFCPCFEDRQSMKLPQQQQV